MSIVRIWHGSSTYPRTGETWDAAFQSIEEMLSVSGTSLVSGDVGLLASDHVCQSGTDPNWHFPVSMSFYSVDRSGYPNETYLAGAQELTTNVDQHMYCDPVGGTLNFEGIEFGVNAGSNKAIYIISGTSQGSQTFNFKDCIFNVGYTGGNIRIYNSIAVSMQDCTVYYPTGADNQYLFVSGPFSKLYVNNTTFAGTPATNLRFITEGGSSNSSLGKAIFTNCDLSGVQSLLSIGITSTCPSVELICRNCILKDDYNLYTTNNLKPLDSVACEYCSTDSISETPSGMFDGTTYSASSVKTINGIYRAATNGEQNWCCFINSNTNASREYPATFFDYPLTTWHDAATSKVLRVHFLSDDANLKDDEIAVIVVHNSEDIPAHTEGVTISTAADYGLGATTASSPYLKAGVIGEWTPGAGTNAYYFEIPGLNPTEPGPVLVYVKLYKPNTQIWVCPNLILQ